MLLRYHIVSTPDQIATIFDNILQNEINGMIKPIFEELQKDCKFDRAQISTAVNKAGKLCYD